MHLTPQEARRLVGIADWPFGPGDGGAAGSPQGPACLPFDPLMRAVGRVTGNTVKFDPSVPSTLTASTQDPLTIPDFLRRVPA
jgi:hypothetical protein